MRSITSVLSALALIAVATPALSQSSVDRCLASADCIRSNLRVMSAGFGYGAATMGGLGTTPDRTMRGLNLRLDVHILSLVLRKLPIATYDAVFTDMTYGKMTSTPLSFFAQDETRGSLPFTYGYHFLAGVRRPGVALMGGLGYQSFNNDIGGSLMRGSATPLTARAELGRRRPIVVQAWAAPSGDGLVSARVDVPLIRLLNLSALYWKADGPAELYNSPTGAKVPATARLLMLGFRTAEIR